MRNLGGDEKGSGNAEPHGGTIATIQPVPEFSRRAVVATLSGKGKIIAGTLARADG